MNEVVNNLPWIAWGGLLGWLLAKAHRGWVVNVLQRRIQLLQTGVSRPKGPADGAFRASGGGETAGRAGRRP
jgi:hypothetical protein